jgi:hypothetical protein
VQVGDIVEHANEPTEWDRASGVMDKFDQATNADGGNGIPWSVAFGNHEIVGLARPPTVNPAGPEGSAIYRHFFGSASGMHRYANQPEFKGASSNDLNTWHIVKSSAAANARSYLMLNLEIDIPGKKPATEFDAMQWAQERIDEHPGLPTIITTHVFEGSKHGPPKNPYLKGFGHNSQLEIFEKLIKVNPQIFMVLSGHTSEETHRVRKSRDGQPVLQLTTDYNKWLGAAGDGYFRLVEIDEAASKLRVRTYSAKLDHYRTNADGEFEVELSFQGRFSAVAD